MRRVLLVRLTYRGARRAFSRGGRRERSETLEEAMAVGDMVAVTDEQIKTNVVNRLYWDGRVDASEVAVAVDSGTVTLHGSVASTLACQAAVSDARNVAGVASVTNELGMRPLPSVPIPPDAEVEDNARAVLRWAPDIDTSTIEASVTAGQLTLKGTVDAFWKKVHTELTGVVEVQNQLTVVPAGDVMDQNIAEDIMAEQERSTLVNADDITVRVDNGTVTLSGSVPLWSARHAAYEAALYTAGVTNIFDHMVVGP